MGLLTILVPMPSKLGKDTFDWSKIPFKVEILLFFEGDQQLSVVILVSRMSFPGAVCWDCCLFFKQPIWDRETSVHFFSPENSSVNICVEKWQISSMSWHSGRESTGKLSHLSYFVDKADSCHQLVPLRTFRSSVMCQGQVGKSCHFHMYAVQHKPCSHTLKIAGLYLLFLNCPAVSILLGTKFKFTLELEFLVLQLSTEVNVCRRWGEIHSKSYISELKPYMLHLFLFNVTYCR